MNYEERYSAGIQILKEFPLIRKLFGAGPDCFACCAYAMPELSDMLYRYFGSARLTNAHNELLTCLVNTGIFGFIFYLGIFVSFIIGSGKHKQIGKIQNLGKADHIVNKITDHA